MAVSLNYTLWRNPDNHSDPVNLTALDESVRQAIDEPALVPQPSWMVEMIQRLRYPMLWEAVRTTWHRDPSDLSAPSRVLTDHANHILMNRFRKELGLGDIGTERFAPRLTDRSVNTRTPVIVDGTEVPAIEIDTDPFVYAVGVQLAAGTVVTAVVPRDELQHIRIAFAQRNDPTGAPA